MTTRTLLSFAATALLAAACNAGANAHSSMDPAAWDGSPVVEGIVRVTGSTPATEVIIRPEENDSPYRATGPLREELRGLSGALVRASGPVEGDRIEVEAYRVVAVDGRPAVSGTVERAGERVWLDADDGRRIMLRDAPASFRTGDRVWVEGEGEEIDVRVYGRIDPR